MPLNTGTIINGVKVWDYRWYVNLWCKINWFLHLKQRKLWKETCNKKVNTKFFVQILLNTRQLMKYTNRGSFICERCRNICEGGCHEKLTAILNGHGNEGDKDLIGRKQIIRCLGKYCQEPCMYQLSDYTPYREEDGVKPLIDLISYLGNKVNQLLEEKYTKKTQDS